MSFKDGFIDGLKDNVGPWDLNTLHPDSTDEELDDSSDENDCGIISREVQDSLLYTSSSNSSQDTDTSTQAALMSLYNSSSDNEVDSDC